MLRRASVFCALWTVASGSSTQRSRALNALRGKSIRVTYTATENPFIFTEAEEWTGILVDFLEELRKETGFVPIFTEVSADSTAVVGSDKNSACPRDIYLNRTDLCVGNSWVTTERLGYAGVSPPFWQEKITLAVRLTDGGLRNGVLQPFQPFASWVWLCIAVVILTYTVCTWYFEHERNNRDFPDKSLLSSIATSLYLALFGFVWSDPPSRPVTAEGRVLAIGFGFFLVLVLLSYTASLALVLVSRNLRPEFVDLPAVIDASATVCMHLSLLPRVEKIFSGLRGTASFIDNWSMGYDRMAAGTCDGLLVGSVFHAKRQELSERECDKVLVGDPVVGISCGWFVADWLASPLSYFMTTLKQRGVLENLRQKYSPKVGCSSSSDVEGLRADDVSGVLFIMAAFFAVGAAVHCFRRCRGRSSTAPRRSPRSSQGSEGSGIDSATPIDLNDPALRLVKTFREERRLEQMPFVKSILVIGQAQLEANGQLLRALSRARAPRGSTLIESPQAESPRLMDPISPTKHADRI